MQAYVEALRAALASLAAHRLRSFLTTLGILIGTASVIAVVSLVQGMSESIKGQFADIGGSTLTLRAENDNDNYRTGKLNNISVADIEVLRHRVAGVGQVAPMLQVPAARASYKGRSTMPEVYGTTSEFQAVRARYPQIGRFIVAGDDASRRRVAVIGTKLRDDLKMPKNPIGEYFMLGGEWFKVVGVMEPQGEIFGFSQDNYAAIPFDVARGMSGYANEPMLMASFTVQRMEEIDAVRERVRRALRASRRVKADAEDTFTVEAADSFVKQFEKVTGTITAVVAGIVGISLLVGGIGIMNIMLVSVTERTREIGILKALGATRRDILVQFLLEAALLALLGGVIGIVLGYAAGAGIAALIPDFPPASVPVWVVLVAAGFSALVGVVFGLMPASKAAGLDPIEALRYE
ncbi:ABC transporter permease [Lysobacter sp. N42]|jgi:putative ABC transport system permease protein|uniref:ABC transporter permease n=1 Tax=Lysobacter sp. N42 TaxID=2545719 RepID=UPI00104DB8A9|nr:ABC transporter permease [Lysobacter sp. N42]TCZ85662.1 ABC transporter permease [Lysobacter sp. N42]